MQGVLETVQTVSADAAMDSEKIRSLKAAQARLRLQRSGITRALRSPYRLGDTERLWVSLHGVCKELVALDEALDSDAPVDKWPAVTPRLTLVESSGSSGQEAVADRAGVERDFE